MPVTRCITILISDNRVEVAWPDGRAHLADFDMTNADLFNNVMYDLTNALSPLLKKAGDPQYGDQFKPTKNHSAHGENLLHVIEKECIQNELEITYWEGEWSVRRSGETKVMRGASLDVLFLELRGVK